MSCLPVKIELLSVALTTLGKSTTRVGICHRERIPFIYLRKDIFFARSTPDTIFCLAISPILQERLDLGFEEAHKMARAMRKVSSEEQQKRYAPMAERGGERWEQNQQMVQGGDTVNQVLDELLRTNIVRDAQAVRPPHVVRGALKPVLPYGHPWLDEDDTELGKDGGDTSASRMAIPASSPVNTRILQATSENQRNNRKTLNEPIDLTTQTLRTRQFDPSQASTQAGKSSSNAGIPRDLWP
ncbi:hypothetical protein P171DRAFT_473834 [Karstenula rhodostoma CBS 690.94]|uniref:Uncharacterized protein n=1 Tax=Karstenula rhodostoma CBS 690.94 TaxID=1392251 RepID=A0A9P4U9M5_9PLEO|nr:hypothetical protein P171DRAFT_473834 [Karstenula rhodostoma CBS 690.94]